MGPGSQTQLVRLLTEPLYRVSTSSLETESLTLSEISSLVDYTGWPLRSRYSHFSTPPTSGVPDAQHHTDLLSGYWGSELSSLCLYGKCFVHSAISQLAGLVLIARPSSLLPRAAACLLPGGAWPQPWSLLGGQACPSCEARAQLRCCFPVL